MKIAILIVGEFRSFEFTRRHMAFLDSIHPDIDFDVYFHTWDKSSTTNAPRHWSRALYKWTNPMLPITEEYVRSKLGVSATVRVRPQPTDHPNYPMLRGWSMGLDLIKESGKRYDYVLIIRPDMFFDGSPVFDVNQIREFYEGKKTFGVLILPPSDNNVLEDTVIFASYYDITRIISKDLFDYVDSQGYDRWHSVWYEYVTKKCGMHILPAPLTSRSAYIARWPINHNSTIRDVRDAWEYWAHSQDFISINVVGDWNQFQKTRHTFEFLIQDDICAQNLFIFDEETHETIQETGFRVDVYNDVNKILESLPNSRYQQTYTLKLDQTLDPVEKLYAYWQKMLEHYEKKNNSYPRYTFIVQSNLIFDRPAVLKMEEMWKINDGLPDPIRVSKNKQGQCTMDLIFAPTRLLKKIFDENFLSNWHMARTRGEDPNYWWNNLLIGFDIYSLPLNTENYVYVSLLDDVPGSYENSTKLSNILNEYLNKTVPWFQSSQFREELRQLHTPDILKKHLHLRDILVIFDLDGVLLESKDMHYDTLNDALKEVDPKFVIDYEDHLKNYNGLPTHIKLKKLSEHKGLPAVYYDLIRKNKQEATIKWLRNMNHEDNRMEFLMQNLKAQNCMIAVASNSVRATVKTALIYLRLIDHVDYFISNEDVKKPKPHPEMFWRCMIDLGYEPKNTMVIEDSEVGLQAAYASGAKVIKVSCPHDITLPVLENAARELKSKS